MTNEELKRAVIDARKNSKYSEVLVRAFLYSPMYSI